MLRPPKTSGFKRFSPSLLAAAAVLLLAACASSTATEFSSTITELDRLPRVRPDFPLPTDPNILFYVQRSGGPNTVVYSARLDAAGHIDRAQPIDVFWRRFTRGGIRTPLTFLERMFVYGVNVRPAPPEANAITANVVSYPQRALTIDLDRDGRPRASIQIGGRQAKLAYVYVEVDESTTIPSVVHVDVFGLDVASGRVLHELFKPRRSQN
jgi:uncharacterized protein DUF4833